MKTVRIMILLLVTMLYANKGSEYIQKGDIFFKNGNFEEAIESYEDALDNGADSSEFYLKIAKAYLAEIGNVSFFTKGLYSSRIQDYLEASIEKDPKNVEAKIYLAQYRYNAPSIGGGDKDEAWEMAGEIMKLSPTEGHKLKGQFYQQEKKIEKAIVEYDQLVKLDPNNTHTYYLIGIMRQQTKDYDKALASFEKALSIDPKSMESLYQIGRNAVFSKKNMDKGIKALNEYLKYDPDKTLPQKDSAYWRLAMIYQIKNDKTKAKEMITKAIEINDKNDAYKKLLKELE